MTSRFFVSYLLVIMQSSKFHDFVCLTQVWALHALALIADCGGPMFRSYVNPTLEQVVDLVMTVPPAITEVHQCLGKCLAALITSIGPELQGKRVELYQVEFKSQDLLDLVQLLNNLINNAVCSGLEHTALYYRLKGLFMGCTKSNNS